MEVGIRQINIKGKTPALSHSNLRFINLVGVEFEGGWREFPDSETWHNDISIKNIPAMPIHNCHLHSICERPYSSACYRCLAESCSSHCPRNCQRHTCIRDCVLRCNCSQAPKPGDSTKEGLFWVGEISSPPMTLEELFPWINLNHPDIVNNTCGLHVHVSTKSMVDYSKLQTRKFVHFFQEWMEDWGNKMKFPPKHDFWTRLQGRNRYCCLNYTYCKEHGFDHSPESQTKITTKDNQQRRAQLNFCYEMHKTLECRMFCALTDPVLIMSAVEALVLCVEAFLETEEDKEEPVWEWNITKQDVEALKDIEEDELEDELCVSY